MERRGGFLEWAFLPPVVAVPTLFVANFLGSPSAAEPVDPSLWGLTGLLFLVLTVLYILFILQGRTTGFLPVQLIAQGMLLCPLALSFGARMLQWLGVTLAVCGAVVLVAIYYYRPGEACFSREGTESASGSDLPVPFAVTDPSGHILSVSDALLEIAGLPREAVLSSEITLLFAPGEDTVTLGEKVWTVSQRPMKDSLFYFQLDPKTLPDAPPPSPPVNSANAFVDLLTGLHTHDYAMRRLEEELYRVRRYGRPLSAVLMRFVFPSSSLDSGEEEGFRAWCRAARSILRAADIAFLLSPRDLFLILPETDGDAAESVVAKLDALIPTLLPSHHALSSAVLLRLASSIKNATGVPDADALVHRVEEELRAKYTLE